MAPINKVKARRSIIYLGNLPAIIPRKRMSVLSLLPICYKMHSPILFATIPFNTCILAKEKTPSVPTFRGGDGVLHHSKLLFNLEMGLQATPEQHEEDSVTSWD
ncbi:hypothetical protein D3C75_666780 [compost metagenome]